VGQKTICVPDRDTRAQSFQIRGPTWSKHVRRARSIVRSAPSPGRTARASARSRYQPEHGDDYKLSPNEVADGPANEYVVNADHRRDAAQRLMLRMRIACSIGNGAIGRLDVHRDAGLAPVNPREARMGQRSLWTGTPSTNGATCRKVQGAGKDAVEEQSLPQEPSDSFPHCERAAQEGLRDQAADY